MKVELLNPETVENIYKTHGVFACECYGTDTSQAEKVGKACAESGHMSGSRTIYINFRLSGIDRGTAEQIMRHEIGTRYTLDEDGNEASISECMTRNEDINPMNIVKNMASFRYIDKSDFEYYMPLEIAENKKLRKLYKAQMVIINDSRKHIIKELINEGYPRQRANEIANFVLPRATTTSLTIGFTPEALIHFMHKRLCTRAQRPIRDVAMVIRNEVKKVNPTLALEFVPHCAWLLWCPEAKGCGKMPSRTEAIEKMRG